MAKKKYSLDLFIGEFVEILTTVEVGQSQENDQGYIQKTQPFVISGVLLGLDDENLYIGDAEGNISDAISRKHYVSLGATKKNDQYDDMLDGLEENGSNGYN